MKKKDSLIDDRFIFAWLIFMNTAILVSTIGFFIDSEMNIQWLRISVFIVSLTVSCGAYKLYRPSAYKIYALALIGGIFISVDGTEILDMFFTTHIFMILVIWSFIAISVPLTYLILFKENEDENRHYQIFRIGLALLLFWTARNLPISIWYVFNNELPKLVPIYIGFIFGLGVAYFSYKHYRPSVYKTYVYSLFLGIFIFVIAGFTTKYYKQFMPPSLQLILLLPSLIDLALGARKNDENNRLPSIETGS